MRTLLLLATLILGSASASALETKGIPAAEIGGFFHLGVRQLDDSKFSQTLDKAFGDEIRASAAFRAFKEKLGFDLEKDLDDVVVGFYPSANPQAPRLAGILRGRFDQAKIEAYAKSANINSTAFGKYTGWDIDQLGSSVDGTSRPANPAKTEPSLIVIVSREVALIGNASQMAAAIDAFQGKVPSFQPKAELSGPGAPFLRVEVDLEALKMPAAGNGDLLRGLLTLGETGPDLVATFDGQVTSAAKATQVAGQVKGMAGLISLGLMDESNKTAEQVAGQRALLGLLQSLKSEAKGDHAVFAVSYDAEKAALGLIKAAVAQKTKAAGGK
jgi:hypothetical protein